MEKGLYRGVSVKVPRLTPECEVRREGGACGHMLSDLSKLILEQHEPAKRHRTKQHNYECREYASNTANIELRIAEATALQIAKDNRTNEVTGYHKENIDTNEATS